MGVYPEVITAALENLEYAGDLPSASATGRAVNFECGGLVEISVGIGDRNGAVNEARFRTNGCGYMAAAANQLCAELTGKPLSGLHGLDDLAGTLETRLTPPICGRVECFAVAVQACKAAFREHRDRCVEEFAGEKALICTCFGVSEETIVGFLEKVGSVNVDEVSASLRAGSGCGSCRMLIQELIDSAGP